MAQKRIYLAGGSYRSFCAQTGGELDLVESRQVRRIGDRDEQRPFVPESDRHGAHAPRVSSVDEVGGAPVDFELVEVDVQQTVALGECARQSPLVDDALFKQNGTERPALALCPLGTAAHRRLVGETERDHRLAKAARAHTRGLRRVHATGKLGPFVGRRAERRHVFDIGSAWTR
ncbi:hypothetical protein HRbin41_00861 [bacterium HR41]|nr:hypothetical protein HRbin41_00861 [bacterium HR41]